MSYISAIKTNNDVLVWERNEHSQQRELKIYSAPYYFYVRHKDGTYTSMYGDKLARHDYSTFAEFQSARADCQSSGIEMFESDIPPELKLLSEKYYGIPAPTLHVSFFDIEVDYDPTIGFASINSPYAPIHSVSIYHSHKHKFVVLTIPPNLALHKPTDDTYPVGQASDDFINEMDSISKLPQEVEIEVRFCKNERELLLEFLVETDDSDVLSGWNSNLFDVPYLGKRLEKIGKQFFNKLSFPQAHTPRFREVEVMGTMHQTLDLSGRISADYMVLFRKYEMAERPSYKLESIAEEILPDLPKLDYEGTLASLYRTNFPWFIRYNLRDTEILKGFEERLGYVELANQMMHLSGGVFKHVTGTLKLAEFAVINYCHHELGGLIVNDIHETDFSHGIKGAFVLLPQIGKHDWIGSIDINSLYPSSIRSINISPETLLGQFTDQTKAAEEIAKGSLVELVCEFDDTIHVPMEFRGKTVTATASDWRDNLQKQKWAISGYGTIFDQNKEGIIPKILGDWYDTRKTFQKAKAAAKEQGDTIKTTYYDKLQYVYKIKLNSFYGSLTNAFFRFYELRMGESTTGTGRMILLHQCAKVCEVLDGEYASPDREEVDEKGQRHFGFSDKWSVVYGDTDSCYFVTHAEKQQTAILIANRVGQLVNDSFQPFMRETFLCSSGYDNIIKCGREIVSDRGIFVDKKRYILHLVDSDGYPVDKMKIMGLDTKKTTMPRDVAAKLNGFIERYLKGEEWNIIAQDIVDYKDQLETTQDVMSIGLPKGIKGVESYTQKLKIDPKTRLPGHISAAICYNICLKKFNDTVSMPITSGMKIKVFYTTNRIEHFKSISIPVDIEQVPQWFLDEFEIDRAAHIKRLVDKPLGNIIKAIDKEVPSKQQLLNDDLLGF